MEIYHGTEIVSAADILGPPSNIDVSLGRGELGCGFYAGSEPSMAASLARGRYKENAAVIQITLDKTEYLKLSFEIVKNRQLLKKHWTLLFKRHETTTFKYGKDVVVAPFATFDFSHQYKFESDKAQNLLNNSSLLQVL